MKNLFPWKFGPKTWVCILHSSVSYKAKYSSRIIAPKTYLTLTENIKESADTSLKKSDKILWTSKHSFETYHSHPNLWDLVILVVHPDFGGGFCEAQIEWKIVSLIVA